MADAQRRLDAYFDELRHGLQELPAAEASDIVAELRSHVRDSAAGGEPSDAEVGKVLERLGPPAALAAQYLTESMIARARRSRAPWLPLKALARLASLSAAGALPLIGLIAGYVVAASLFVAALVKPFAPDRVGLWRLAGGELSLRLGFRSEPPALAQELLGWWITPLGLFAGAAAYSATLSLARLALRHFRPARALGSTR